MRTTRVSLLLVLLQAVQFTQGRTLTKRYIGTQGRTLTKRYIGFCNSFSGNCGAGCNTNNDCQGGGCWAGQDNCGTIGYCNSQSGNCGDGCNTANDCQGGACWASQDTCGPIGYCNSQSTNCGAGCNINSDCQGGGGCWANLDNCPTPSSAGTCNAASSNCGTPCNIQSDCPGGDCWSEAQTCNTPSFAGTCNAASSNCGTSCNIQSDCPGGDCWSEAQTCNTPSFAGTCNAASSNCGTSCNIQSDCPGGDCWSEAQTCNTPSFAGTCNAASSNCGTSCNIQSECPGGDCWAAAQTCTTTAPTTTSYCNDDASNCGDTCNSDSDCPGGICGFTMDVCPSPPTNTDYCNAASDNCGAGCNTADDCPNGDCITGLESCGTPGGHVIGTYIGALPDGVSPPPLSQVPAEVNFILLGFAKDVNYNGQFVPFSEWTRLGITKTAITADKAAHPDRKYMVSLGGAADYGGTFSIQAGINVEQWLNNAYASIKAMVDNLNADGVDIQFEGGTKNANFPEAVRGLLQRFKAAGYLTSVGPFYGGTWSDYVNLNLQNANYVFCQFYAKNLQTVSAVENDLMQAAADLGGWDKLVAGFNSNGRNPNPSIALQAVENLKGDLKGTFTWAAEHSKTNNPAYCIEKNSKKILVDNESPGSCSW